MTQHLTLPSPLPSPVLRSCVRQMVSVAAMLSSEHVYAAGQGPGDALGPQAGEGRGRDRRVGWARAGGQCSILGTMRSIIMQGRSTTHVGIGASCSCS